MECLFGFGFVAAGEEIEREFVEFTVADSGINDGVTFGRKNKVGFNKVGRGE